MLNNGNIEIKETTITALGKGKKALGEILQTVFNMKREAKIFEGKAEELKKESNALLSSVNDDTGLEEFESNLGKIKLVAKTSKSINGELLMAALIKRGINVVDAAAIMAESTKSTPSASWTFYAAKVA
jgi:uncharacterized membrane protein YdbT with pleckstrin-like domain